MSNVISIFKNKDKPKVEVIEENKDFFNDNIKLNELKKEKLKEQMLKANKKVLHDYRINK